MNWFSSRAPILCSLVGCIIDDYLKTGVIGLLVGFVIGLIVAFGWLYWKECR